MDEYPEMLAVVRALASHLKEFPQHSDSAKGIATWWFRDGAVVDGQALADALEWMRARGLLEVRAGFSGAGRYRCIASPQRLDDVLLQLSRRLA